MYEYQLQVTGNGYTRLALCPTPCDSLVVRLAEEGIVHLYTLPDDWESKDNRGFYHAPYTGHGVLYGMGDLDEKQVRQREIGKVKNNDVLSIRVPDIENVVAQSMGDDATIIYQVVRVTAVPFPTLGVEPARDAAQQSEQRQDTGPGPVPGEFRPRRIVL